MLKKNKDIDYRNYRWFYTNSKKLVIGGKSDEQNELVIKHFLNPDYTILHTTKPGSPFMIIQSKDASKQDIDEAAMITASFSQQFKEPIKKIEVDVFKGENIYKTKYMKVGTFGVKGDKKTIKIIPELYLVIQKGKLRCVTKYASEKKIVKITKGKLSKEEAAKKISEIMKNKFGYPVSLEEIMQAIPSNKIKITNVK